MNQDLLKMKPQIFSENKEFCLTPENKIDKWIQIIHKKALDGYKVKLYSDIESTGFAFWNRGRAKYDEVIDKPSLEKDSLKWFIEITTLIDENFILDLTHPLISTSNFNIKEPSKFACMLFSEPVLTNSYQNNWEEVKEKLLDKSIDLHYYEQLFEAYPKDIQKELILNAQKLIKRSQTKALKALTDEAKKLETKVDRMIEFAFVTCYENKDGEVFLLKDDEGDLIYLHEFILPHDGKVKDTQVIDEMPIIPYLIHKTSFDFLKGEEQHPFLNIKLNKKAPNAGELFKVLLRAFNYDDKTKEEKQILSDNIMFFYHNGNGFDVPFIDEELNRYHEDQKLRDLAQVYDTLKIAKAMIPSDAQKFIAACQHNKNFGGKESLKNDPERGIQPTSKSLDNIKRLATYLIDFDPEKPKRIYEKAQEIFFNEFKNYFENEKIDWQKFENMLEYSNNKNPDLNLTKGFKKPTKREVEYATLMERYSKYLEGRKDYVQALNKLKKHELIYKNIHNIKDNIKNNNFLQEALYRLNNVDRSAHGARVDSQLFMDAFIVLENAFYLKPKMANETRSIKVDDLSIPDDIQKLLEEKLKGV